jgi:transcriptional regulator with GAF, ATPase, and Fis domain
MGSPRSGRETSLETLNVRELDDRLSRNWYLLVFITVASTCGFAVAILPLVLRQLGLLWPWPHAHILLLSALVMSVVVLVAYITRQQRRIGEICRAIRTLELQSIERERHSHTRLNSLLNISRMMRSMRSSEDLFKSVMDTCIEMFRAQQASLMLLDADSNDLVVRAVTGHPDTEHVRNARQKIGEGVAGWVAEKRKPVLLGPGAPLSRYPGLDVNISEMTAALVAPVLLRDELVGVISIRSRDPDDRYNESDLQALLVLAENVGTAIRQTEYVEWIKNIIERHPFENRKTPVL